MNKYDYRNMLAKAYDEGISKEGLSIDTLDDIAAMLEVDKPRLNSVFGVGYSEEYEGELCVFLSDASTWKDEGYCADCYDDEDDSYGLLNLIGLHEACDGVFQQPYRTEANKDEVFLNREEIIALLVSYGLEYDQKFEEFMLDF